MSLPGIADTSSGLVEGQPAVSGCPNIAPRTSDRLDGWARLVYLERRYRKSPSGGRNGGHSRRTADISGLKATPDRRCEIRCPAVRRSTQSPPRRKLTAAKARDRKAYELAGEFAYLNFPDEIKR